VFEVSPHLWVGLPGLATDIQTVNEKLKFRTNMYELKEGRKMKPQTFAAMLSNMLYERRFGPFFVEPIVAGLDPVTKESYICAMDCIGCKTVPDDFVVAGTAEEQLFGESSWL
jgi:20S proteasome subunit beta 3